MPALHLPQFKKAIASCLLCTISVIAVCGQHNSLATAPGEPALSQAILDQYRSVYEYLLELKLNEQQKIRLQNGVMHYWKINNPEAIEQIISDVKYYGKTDELESLRNSSQSVIVEAFRRDTKDSVSLLWTEAYDAAHPERMQATKAKSFTDIVGTWKRTDGLLAEKTYSTQPAGVSYTESETIDISADGKFKHTKVHSHYSGTCSQTDGKTEYGVIKLDGTKMIFEIQSGTEMVEDACSPSLNSRQAIKPRKESFPWTIKTNPDNNNVLTLCWNTSNTTALCFEKQ